MMNKEEEEHGPIQKKRIIFGLHLPKVGLYFLQDVVYTNVVAGKINYTLKAAFEEGLRLLQEKNPDIPERESVERRYYRGGKQRKKEEVYQTSFTSTIEDKNWIENYIVFKLKEDLYFSKISFIYDLIEELRISYKDKLLKIPNRVE